MKIIFFTVSILFLLSSPITHAQEKNLDLELDLELERIQSAALNWVPDGKRPRELPEACSTQQLEKIILNEDTHDRSIRLVSYFKDCEKYHTFLGESGITALLQMFNMDYDYQDVPYVRPLTLKMKDGAILNAVLALKPDISQPRPLVIVQCGLTCNTISSPSVRWPLMHLFDETPFHVLIIGSSTTAEFALANKKFYAGGLQEGLYLNEIARWLKSSESQISKYVSSVHVQGMSLGGHGALYSALYSQESDGNLIRSSQAYCPVVELKPSIDNIMQDTLPGRFLQNKVWKQMQQMIGQVPVIDRMIPNGKKPSGERIKEIVAQASIEYFDTSSRNAFTNIFKFIFKLLSHTFPKTIDEFWSSNRFSALVQNLKTPVLIWSADDDPAVIPKENSLVLLDYANKENSPLTVINTARGSHCGFALSHGWDIYSTIMKSYIIAHSPEFREIYREHKRDLGELQNEPVVLAQGQRHFSQSFQLERGNQFMRVTYQIFDPNRKKCRQQDPFLVEDTGCFETKSAKINISDIREKLLFVPQNDAIAEMLTRWANANLSIVDENGNRLVNTEQVPAYLTWREID